MGLSHLLPHPAHAGADAEAVLDADVVVAEGAMVHTTATTSRCLADVGHRLGGVFYVFA